MLREVVPLVLSPSSDLDPAREARLLARMLEVEKMIDGLQGVIDLEAIFPNSKRTRFARLRRASPRTSDGITLIA